MFLVQEDEFRWLLEEEVHAVLQQLSQLLKVGSCSGVTGGGRGQSAPLRLLTVKFLLTYQEKKARKKREKGENEEEKKENCIKEGGKLKIEGEKVTK